MWLATGECQEWLSARKDELDEGDVETITGALSRLRSKDKAVRKEIKTVGGNGNVIAFPGRSQKWEKMGCFWECERERNGS